MAEETIVKMHSTLGPSNAKRWINCPGSVALSANAPKPRTSEAAAEGTVAHMVAEKYATGSIGFDELYGMLGKVVVQDDYEIEIDEEMIDGAVEYLEAIDEARKVFRRDNRPAPVVEAFEKRVHAKSIDEACWGTADHYIYRKGHILIVNDYKYGKGVIVDPEENEQASIYAVGVMDDIGSDAFDSVWVQIIQPRGNHVDGVTRTWKTTPKALREFVAKIAKPAALESRQPNARVVEGEWCRWCPAQAFCPAKFGATQTQAQVQFDVVAPTPEDKAKRLPDIKLVPIEKLAQALEWQDAVESWFVAVKAAILEHLSAGKPLAGWKIVEGRANRQWKNEAEVIALYESVLGDSLWEKKLLSPSKLEKATRAKKGSIDHLTFKPEGKKSVAPMSDPRPAAATAAQDAFAALPAPAAKPDEMCPMCDMGCCVEHLKGAVAGSAPMWPR